MFEKQMYIVFTNSQTYKLYDSQTHKLTNLQTYKVCTSARNPNVQDLQRLFTLCVLGRGCASKGIIYGFNSGPPDPKPTF